MAKTKKKTASFESKKSRYGLMFISTWIFGILTFFLIPMIKSVWYAFSDVYFDMDGVLKSNLIGLENFKYLFNIDPDFINNLRDSVISFLYKLPIIVILAMLFAVMLNKKFKGRMLMRSLFFLPVIIATGVVMQKINTSSFTVMDVSGASGNAYSSDTINLQMILINMNLSNSVVKVLMQYISEIFNLIWSVGVQVVLFISGLQTIPAQLYEVSKVEGATKWEEFWFITIPMMRNIIFLVMIFTVVDLFVTVDSPVIAQAYALLDSLQYGSSSAMLWMYFLIVGGISGVILLLFNRFCAKKWE